MNLRQYQTDAIAGIRAAYAAGKRAPLLCSPTGSGKTQMFAFVAHGAAAKGKRVVIVVHRRELTKQAARTLDAWGVKHGQGELVELGMVGALANAAPNLPAPDLLVFDEAHHACAETYRRLRAAWPSSLVLGVSATPCRLDGKPLGDVFDALIQGPTVRWLTDAGFLSPAKYYAPPSSLDLTGVKRTGGDFNRAGLEGATNKPVLVGQSVDHFRRLCPDARAVAFCVSVKHAQDTADAFNAAGIPAASIDGGMSADERDGVNAKFAAGILKVLTSCELVSEGYDIPACDCVILMRPTASLGMHLQQLGRALRIAPGKTHATALDMVGNLARHGLAEDDRTWSLSGKVAATSKGPPPMSLCQCKKCFAVFKPARMCPECGYAPPTKSRKLATEDGDLVPFVNLAGESLAECPSCSKLRPDDDSPCACGHDPAEAARREARREVALARTLTDLQAIAKARGYHPGWALKRFSIRRAKHSTHAA